MQCREYTLTVPEWACSQVQRLDKLHNSTTNADWQPDSHIYSSRRLGFPTVIDKTDLQRTYRRPYRASLGILKTGFGQVWGILAPTGNSKSVVERVRCFSALQMRRHVWRWLSLMSLSAAASPSYQQGACQGMMQCPIIDS